MNVSKLSLVPLQHASLCVDCEMITVAHTHCCACGSAALLNLARTLNGGEDFSPMPKAFAAVASISDRRALEARANYDGSFRPRPLAECVPFPQISAEIAAESQAIRRPYSLREVAAAVQRAMTIAIVGILALGAAIEARGRTLDIASAGTTVAQMYSRLRR
jgi:hypothetical protein